MDDIICMGKTKEELRANTEEVLKVLEEHELYVKDAKCYWEVEEVPVLGFIVSENQVRTEPAKIEVVKTWKVPTCKKDVQKFLGFMNFYRRFIEGYGRIAKPLHLLTGEHPFEWTKSQQESFEELKYKLTEAPVLALPNLTDQFRVEVDASGYALGGVLSQKQNGKWKPIAFISRTMSPAEVNYEIYDKELLAIMYALDKWRHYLMGAEQQFEVLTDHKNLEYFRKPQKLNGRQARWHLQLQNFDFTLRHIPGTTNSKADILSRLPWYKENMPEQKDVQILKDTAFFKKLTMLEDKQFSGGGAKPISVKNITISPHHLLERIRTCKSREHVVTQRMKDKPHLFNEQGGLLYAEGKLYIPPNPKLRQDIMRDMHDAPVAGHPGVFRTDELIRRQYWWPSLLTDVKKYVKGCDACQRNKAIRQKKSAPLHPHDIPQGPWQEISADLIGPLPESKGSNAILAITDRFSKMIHLIPTNVTLTAGGLAELYRDHVWKHHGLPKRVTSDRGPQFAASFMTSLCKNLGIKQNLSTAYHPQTDGQVERSHQETEAFLRSYINHLQDDWADWLSIAEFQYNDKRHSATNSTAFFLNYGYHPWKGEINAAQGNNEAAGTFATQIDNARKEASASMARAQEAAIHHYNLRKKEARQLKAGDQVWLEASNLKSKRPSKKLDHKRYGPFQILEKKGEAAYKLKLPETWEAIHPVFHESLLTPFNTPGFPSQKKKPPPPPVIIGDEKEFEVERILNSERRNRKVLFLVRWKGEGPESDQWEPRAHLKNAKKLLEAFHKRYPTKPY
jgi:hypothetical protein